MDKTTHLSLPYIAPSQAQKHVTHNEAIRLLDALVMLCVESRDLSTPPDDPTDGMRFIVGAAPEAEWSGHDHDIAIFVDGAWAFATAQNGWLCWCAEDEAVLVYNNQNWEIYGMTPSTLDNVLAIGINTQANEANRLTIAADTTLLTADGSDHRLIINKQSQIDTASIVFQDNYSGRAEIGLVGNDNFAFKVSADGSIFNEAIIIDRGSGDVSFPHSNLLKDYTLNLYQDSGRQCANIVNALQVGPYQFPSSYLATINSSLRESAGKFIHNNTTHGGNAGALNGDVAALVSKIKSPALGRYGAEYYLTKVTQGPGTVDAQAIGANTGYLGLASIAIHKPASWTFHAYFCVKTLTMKIRWFAGRKIFVDGVAQTSDLILSPSDGWVSVAMQGTDNPYSTNGYQPYILQTYAPIGAEYLFACPALMAGITNIDPNIGLITAYNSWPTA